MEHFNSKHVISAHPYCELWCTQKEAADPRLGTGQTAMVSKCKVMKRETEQTLAISCNSNTADCNEENDCGHLEVACRCLQILQKTQNLIKNVIKKQFNLKIH